MIGAAGGIAQDQANQAMEAQKKKFSEMPKPWFIMRILNWLILYVVLPVFVWACVCAYPTARIPKRTHTQGVQMPRLNPPPPPPLLKFLFALRSPSRTWRGPRRSRVAAMSR